MKSCDNCHLRFARLQNCWDKIGDENCPYWEPETNGDKVRQMNNDELVELWGKVFPGQFAANCNECKEDYYRCGFYNCNCPKAFKNWLEAVADVPIQEKEKKGNGKI